MADDFDRSFPSGRIVEHRVRIDCWAMQRAGVLSSDRIAVVIDQGEVAINLVKVEPMPGVPRIWFECGQCHRKARHIYLPDILCRSCLALEYSIQHTNERWRILGRIARLKRRRGNPQRRRARYWQLTEQIEREETKLAVVLRRFNEAAEEVPHSG